MVKRKVKNKAFLDALKAHYESEAAQAIATLALYLDNPLAVADHEDVVGSMKKLTRQVTEAHDCLDTLEELFD